MTMKKTAAVVLTVLHLVTSGLIYPQAMTVTKVNKNSMKIRTATGITYTVKQDPEDYEVGDIVACIMYTKGTKNVKDDQVITMRYTGFGG